MPNSTARVSLIYRVVHRVLRHRQALTERFFNRFRSTYPSARDEDVRPLNGRFSFLTPSYVSTLAEKFPEFPHLVMSQARSIVAHQFDLLGSGPTYVRHGTKCRGLEGHIYDMSKPISIDREGRWLDDRINRTNLAESKRIWGLLDGDYVPVDWQLDFKSGYRWEESTWHRDIAFAHLPGVDIKVPWELSRMQHLPALGLACHFSQLPDRGDARERSVYANEFRNQVLDFVATNPPGFGVNWACPMDIAIRAANLLVARDIVLASGAELDHAFEAVFRASLLAHARHVHANLEWSPRFRGNHYLANVVGLLFVAAYLPNSREVEAWLVFAFKELLNEMNYQFHPDGSNFEASVCYHRLSAEMVMWGLALLNGLPANKLALLNVEEGGLLTAGVPAWCWSRLAKMADFTQAMTRPDHLVVQFGDNDSGRFLVIGSGERLRARNDPRAMAWSLDHGSLVAGIRALTGNASTYSPVSDDPYAHLVSAFASGEKARQTNVSGSPTPTSEGLTIGSDEIWTRHMELYENAPMHGRWADHFAANSTGLLRGMRYQVFSGMGCFIFRSARLYLAIRCGEIGIAGLGAHAHCDQLGIELVIDDTDRVRDPGTYIYTPSLDKRNAYRSASAHHVPRVAGREPANLALGPFDLRGAAVGECLFLGSRGFVGRHAGYGPWVYRIVAVEDDGISVFDFSEGELSLADPTPICLPFSSGYGYPVDQAYLSS